LKKVIIHTDGGCEPNPGPGGWAAVIRYNSEVHEISGGEENTTNNRMEMTAVIKALEALHEPHEVELYTDSEYLCKGMMEWLPMWKAKGRLQKGSVKNADLWQRIDELMSRHLVKCYWVKGHAGNTDNERCDKLAYEEIKKIYKQKGQTPPPPIQMRLIS